MIIEIENNKNGEQIGAIQFDLCEKYGDFVIENMIGNVNFLDEDLDDIFDTNDTKIRIGIEPQYKTISPFMSLNYETLKGNILKLNENGKGLVKELNSYCAILKWYNKKLYDQAGILIENYLGHIDYGKEFGYFKTHEEICMILYQNLLRSISFNKYNEAEQKECFRNFCNRQINKIRWNLENKHDFHEIDDEYIQKRIRGEFE